MARARRGWTLGVTDPAASPPPFCAHAEAPLVTRLARGPPGGAFGVQGGLQQDSGRSGVHDQPAGPGILPAPA